MGVPDRDGVRDRYDELLDIYQLVWQDEDYQSMHFGYYDEDHSGGAVAVTNTVRQLATLVEIDSTDRVLDVGCGAGGDAVWNAQTLGASVLGIDIGQAQLELAREHATEVGVSDRVSFQQDDFHDLSSIADASFDVAWALEALSHSDEKAVVLEQLHDAVGPRGRLAIGDLFRTASSEPDSSTERFESIEEAIGLAIDPIEAVAASARDAGFEDVECHDVTAAVTPGVKQSARSSLLAYPLARLAKLVGLASATHVDFFRCWFHLRSLIEEDRLGYYFLTANG